MDLKIYPVVCLALLLCSCASTGSFSPVENELEQSHYAAGAELLGEKRDSLYTSRDTILFLLDKGMLAHYAGMNAESSRLLEDAERAIDEAFTKSITQGIASLMINDNSLDYSGEDYEDIYINVFNALNYYHRDNIEGAMVEIRKMTNKLQHLAVKYDVVLSGLQRMALDEGLPQLPSNSQSTEQFANSALGRYLGMLFYRGAGLYDNARIDRDWLLAAFANAPEVYGFPVPSSINGELEIPQGTARLNVLAFAGLSPIKKENVTRIPLLTGGWVKIALPQMASRHSSIARVDLVFDSGEIHNLELLEDIDAVARAAFRQREQVIYLRTVIRAMLKGVSSSALRIAARETDGSTSLVLDLLGFIAQIFAEASESADIRVSRFFPARAYVGGINLPPGSYTFQVKYYTRNGREIASVLHQDMVIRENDLNLAQAVSLR